ncbi:aryl-sulfate sulfotransferase [Algoriphagus sp. oki45]|uniref:aryl-sulfate sulfotransferase n=1 Tax=Algoriphagus sp. oki45 TaxID=3067294 RepID=UPI0027F3363A|nr:aryl-sulfate sulfotransferase [Algoriphagus sp. oki45]
MRLKYSYLTLILLVFSLGCEEDEDFIPTPGVIYSSSDAINRFTELEEAGILVLNTNFKDDIYQLILENGDTLKLDARIVNEYQLKAEEWTTQIKFQDGTIGNAPSLGNSLDILPENIQLNPSGFGPLSAKVGISMPVKGKFKFRVIGKNGPRSDIGFSPATFAKDHQLDVFGLYGNHENTLEISFLDNLGKERIKKSLILKTDPLPEKLPLIEIDVAKREEMEGDLTLVSYRGLGIPFMPFIMDSFGDFRWYLDFSEHPVLSRMSFGCGIERLKNGNLYFGDDTIHEVFELDFHGNVVKSWKFEGYTFHHNVIEKPNGNLLVAASKNTSQHLNGKTTINDIILELDRTSGQIVKEWDLKQCLDENRIVWMNNLGNAVVNWLHNNGLYYDENDDSIIITARFQGAMKITSDNRLKWILAPHLDWGKDRNGIDLTTKLLQPLDQNNQPITDLDVLEGRTNHPEFEWAWYPHAPLVKSRGVFMFFDNGDTRNYAKSEFYSRAVEYRIDEENMTVKQVWQYGKEREIETYSRIQSDVDFLPNKNNVLFIPGWNVDNGGKFGGKVVEIDYTSREVVFEAKISPSSGQQALHRAEKISFY